MKYLIVYLIISISLIVELSSQDSKQELSKLPAQVTFIYPLGTNGIRSQNYSYDFSLNILAGRTGASNRCEISGLLNVNEKYTKGFQGAGIGNVCFGYSNDFQGAGIFNYVAKDFSGLQAAGITNFTTRHAKGAQAAGIANFSTGVKGVQMAGILNISADSVDGSQLAGIANLCIGNSKNIQAAGIVNVGEQVIGAQIAGITNAAMDINGAQIAGIANIAKDVDGLQLAGIINICDSINGIPIALISYVHKNGYKKIEFSSNEITQLNLTAKTGVIKFYTLFTLGYSTNNPDYNIAFGFGLGTSILVKKKSAFDLELRSSQITKDFRVKYTLINNSLILDYSTTIFNKVEIFAGPTFNLLVSNSPIDALKIAPSWARAYKHNNKLYGWIGFHAGLRL